MSTFFFSESLDDLTNLVIKLFSDAVDKTVTIPEFPDHPYSDEHLQVRKIAGVRGTNCNFTVYFDSLCDSISVSQLDLGCFPFHWKFWKLQNRDKWHGNYVLVKFSVNIKIVEISEKQTIGLKILGGKFLVRNFQNLGIVLLVWSPTQTFFGLVRQSSPHPHEHLLKSREHSLSFICLCPNHGCRLCPKDWLEIM